MRVIVCRFLALSALAGCGGKIDSSAELTDAAGDTASAPCVARSTRPCEQCPDGHVDLNHVETCESSGAWKASACSCASGGPITDGEAAPDSSGRGGGGCSPADVNAFVPAYHPAAAHRAACSQALIDAFYTGCLSVTATQQTCAPFGNTGDAAHRACAACIVTPDTAASYGPVISHRGLVTINVAGCMDLKDFANGLACAKQYQATEQCEDAACAASCPVVDDASYQLYESCLQSAASNGCKAYADASKPCADAEAASGPASVCFVGQTFQDQYNAIVRRMNQGGYHFRMRAVAREDATPGASRPRNGPSNRP